LNFDLQQVTTLYALISHCGRHARSGRGSRSSGNRRGSDFNSPEGAERVFHGVLLMSKEEGSEELSPLYHLVSPEVWRSEGYSKQMLF